MKNKTCQTLSLLFTLFCISGCLFDATAQITHRDLLQQFTRQQLEQSLVPRDQFKPFPQSPEAWKKQLPDSLLQKLIGKGEAAQGKEFKNIPATAMLEFVRTGNRGNYESLSFAKRRQLWYLVMAESVEGKGRFTDQIVNGIWSICEESFWGISAHVGAQKAGTGLPDVEDPIVDLFAAETASILAWTDYFIGPELEKVSKLVRPRIRYEINRRILLPMRTTKFGWMGGGNPNARLNNWAPWIISNYFTAILLTEENQTDRAADLYLGMKVLDQYINGLGTDGGCDEGPSYWFAAGGCVYDGLKLLYDATGGKLDIFHDPFIQKMGSYIYKTHIAGKYFINVADAHPEVTPDGPMLFRFGNDINDPVMMQFGSWCWHNQAMRPGEGGELFMRSRYLYDLAALNGCDNYPSAPINITDVWFSDVQLMAARSANGFYLAAHGGNNGESHNHNDVGDFMIYVNDQPLIIDVGSGTYTARTFSKDRYKIWFNTSPYHNLPVINGVEQGGSTNFAASDVKYQKGELSMNIAGAYPPEAGITVWQRTVKMDKSKGVEVMDHYKSQTPLKSITQSFMTVCNTDTDHPGQVIFFLSENDSTKVYLTYDAAMWDVRKEKMILSTAEDNGLNSSWKGKDIWRILLVGKTGNTEGTFRYLIHK